MESGFQKTCRQRWELLRNYSRPVERTVGRKSKVMIVDLALLHALYLQILHGNVDHASEDVKKDLKEEVLKEWKTIQGVSRERLFVYFASELASRNE